MESNVVKGRRGERLAVEYLISRGYRILHRNYRFMRHEIDIIASRENVVHFIEVKARSTLNFGLPEESVSNTKLESMMTAAEEYLWRNRRWTRVQYDIVAIVDIGSDQPKLMLIEDVYF